MSLDFLDVPRGAGNPRQEIADNGNPCVYSKNELIDFIKKNNDGDHDVFISHNSYISFLDRKPFQINVNKIFLDFDSKFDPPVDAFEDIKKVIGFFDEHEIPYIVAYSGKKGGHIYIELKSDIHINASYLKKMYKSIMIHLKTELNLTTIDPSVATPTKLCRVWYTKHPKSGRYCCPLPQSLIDQGLDEIIKYSSVKPKPWHTDILKDKQLLTIEEYIKFFDIDLKDETKGVVFATTSEKYNNPDNAYLRELLHYPCLINSILDIDNAVHFARFACCLHLKRIGCDPLYVFQFFKQRQYMDVEFENECKYQINTIFGTDYTFPSCKKFKENGMCIGSTCKYYRD
jgi:hypothetical protein